MATAALLFLAAIAFAVAQSWSPSSSPAFTTATDTATSALGSESAKRIELPRLDPSHINYVSCSYGSTSWEGTYTPTSFCMASSMTPGSWPPSIPQSGAATVIATSTILSTSTTVPSSSNLTLPAPGIPTPSTSTDALQKCYSAAGGLGKDGVVGIGCGSMLQHVTTCYNSLAPWVDPYNSSQSELFQSCLCQTSSKAPFTDQSVLWQNFTGCANCLLTYDFAVPYIGVTRQLQRFDNFCRSQQPIGYLFLIRLEDWLHSLSGTAVLATPALTGEITKINTLQPLFTTTPPLANLAYAASAPFDGSLGAVTPDLTTYTAITSGPGSLYLATVTSLVKWVPTATSASDFTLSSASVSAEGAVSAQLSAALSSIASSQPSQGGPSTRCIGHCPSNGAAARILSTAVAQAGLVAAVLIILTLGM